MMMKFSSSFVVLLLVPCANAFVGLASPKQQRSAFRSSSTSSSSRLHSAVAPPVSKDKNDQTAYLAPDDAISAENPMRVLIAGAGVGGLALANVLYRQPHIDVQILEQTAAFKRFGGPIQLASNALQLLKEMDEELYEKIDEQFTVTGDKMNGIKDGIRTEWYAKFDLKSPAEDRNMPFTGVIDRPVLQDLCLKALPEGTVRNGAGVETYEQLQSGSVKVILKNGDHVVGDVLIGADGIWSAVRSTMRGKPAKGPESGASYSGYTVFAGELAYASPDNGEVGYKVYIGPGQYFVITDIGKGNYQWYAFLARPAGSSDNLEKPNGSTSEYLQEIFKGWSPECHAILSVTKENEIEQRDLYDRPPSVFEPWTNGTVALLGDGIHAMMPNLGQGGCQAIEDAYVLGEELRDLTSRKQIEGALQTYQRRRLIRSAAVQGLSRFASDIIIRGFDTPAKIVKDEVTGEIRFENFNYAGIVTKMLQPILPIFFIVQFNFLYDGYKNKQAIDFQAALGFIFIGGVVLFLLSFEFEGIGLGLSLGAEAVLGTEGVLNGENIISTVRDFLPF